MRRARPRPGNSRLPTDRKPPLYTADILAAAVRLADHPLDAALPLTGEARSRSCGSTLSLRLALDDTGRIVRVGCRAQACAVGQAAASLFVDHAAGRNAAELAKSRDELAHWLTRSGPQPDWPGIALLDAARAYPARHGAILLAWNAALAALASQRALR